MPKKFYVCHPICVFKIAGSEIHKVTVNPFPTKFLFSDDIGKLGAARVSFAYDEEAEELISHNTHRYESCHT